MAFQFPLQAVLHFRQGVERQQELRLIAANLDVARMRRALEDADLRLQEARAQRGQRLQAGTTAAELAFALSCEATLGRQRVHLEGELVRLQRLRDEQQKIFQQGRRQRETLESVRDLQFHQYERAVARREQRELDEQFLMRRTLLGRG